MLEAFAVAFQLTLFTEKVENEFAVVQFRSLQLAELLLGNGLRLEYQERISRKKITYRKISPARD